MPYTKLISLLVFTHSTHHLWATGRSLGGAKTSATSTDEMLDFPGQCLLYHCRNVQGERGGGEVDHHQLERNNSNNTDTRTTDTYTPITSTTSRTPTQDSRPPPTAVSPKKTQNAEPRKPRIPPPSGCQHHSVGKRQAEMLLEMLRGMIRIHPPPRSGLVIPGLEQRVLLAL
ncbi:hypothetical protein EX30DRAFT_225470 [Ascodesmis nigricans]|uniref:Uncharacterized protein n=1 Tax=Ascodesmis nigricans TaxID=341454 RepID=A0A4V3SHN6_9PEZI|nr:hypothetical protein EX30DRAFT_225470 [Ascodesmis nigricans]